MKKIFLLMLAMVMSFTLVACGGNNDENNAAIQVKMDETKTLVQEINDWYKDNGFLEGDTAEEFQKAVDTLTAQMDELQASHQEILDAGGYSDEDAAAMAQTLDAAITGFKEVKEEQKAIKKSVEEEEASEDYNLTDLEGEMTEAYMGVTEAEEGFYYASNADGSLTIIIVADPKTAETASFVGKSEQVSDNQLTVTDETSGTSLTFSISPQDDGTLLLDLGNLGQAVIAECEPSVVLEAMQVVNDNGIPVL
ncbi:MAG: hypothetical protein K0S71_1063 [Clostridia bacterium]|nr:hypothetical protein [Clostridia bacterium]